MTELIEKWECNRCRDTEGVINGICPTCGPTQTMPINKEAKKIAKVKEANQEKIDLDKRRAIEIEKNNIAKANAKKK